MKKILLISPHFDDAVLSAGQFMADRPDAEVVTVYGGFPLTPDRIQTPYDEKCGFKDALDAVTVRRWENDASTALLEATAINLEFPDSQYENKIANHVQVEDIISRLQEIVDSEDYEFIMAPLGLGHPDHIKVTDAVVRLNTRLPIYFWEDLPLRVVEPELVWSRLALFGLGKPSQLWQPGTTGDKMAKKVRAMLCYKSQVNTGILDPYVMYVPERFWKYK
jgi:LmbE family N-acetylglucosaminyl deacetylase